MNRCGECRTERERENEETAHLYARVEKLEAALREVQENITHDCVTNRRASIKRITEALKGE
jgi:hypothetical protein